MVISTLEEVSIVNTALEPQCLPAGVSGIRWCGDQGGGQDMGLHYYLDCGATQDQGRDDIDRHYIGDGEF